MSNERRFEVQSLDLIVHELMDLYEEIEMEVETKTEFNFSMDFDLPVGLELQF